MNSVKFDILPAPKILERDVECFCIVEYAGSEEVSISVSPQAVPGIVFQHHNGQSAIRSIVTDSVVTSSAPILFLYGPGIQPSTMNFTRGPYVSIQVVLKPHALHTLLGLDAAVLSDRFVELNECSAGALDSQLLDAGDPQKQVTLLTDFLVAQLRHTRARDEIVAESLRLIHHNIAWITVKYLLEYLSISERHFERKFRQTVGVSPKSYIRVKRFHAAMRLIKSGEHEKLTDIAYALGFYDQSHLIRDIKLFAGITPKHAAQNRDDFYHDQVGYSYA